MAFIIQSPIIVAYSYKTKNKFNKKLLISNKWLFLKALTKIVNHSYNNYIWIIRRKRISEKYIIIHRNFRLCDQTSSLQLHNLLIFIHYLL